MPVLLGALSDQAHFAVRAARDLLCAVVEHALGSTLWVRVILSIRLSIVLRNCWSRIHWRRLGFFANKCAARDALLGHHRLAPT